MSKNTPLAIVILAAGKGTRMKSALPKVMHKIAGRPIIGWLIEKAESLNPEKIIVVTAPDMVGVADLVKPHTVAIQKEQNGTGDAVKPAMEHLKGFDGRVLVLMGDEPFLDSEILSQMVASDDIAVMAVNPPSAYGLGRMSVNKNGTLDKIIEDKDCSEKEKKITLCNAGNFCFPAGPLSGWLDQLQNNNNQNEYYLIDISPMAKKEKIPTHVFETDSEISWGINNRSELAEHEHIAQMVLREIAMQNGVTLIDPSTVTLSWDTVFGQDVVIEPNVVFGEGVTIADGVTIHSFSHIVGATIEKSAEIGPFARIRPKSTIGKNASIGNFIEVNRSTIQNNAKAKHVSYIGDATIGENANIGAGTVIANYDGFFKHQSTIEKNVFIGSNSTIISPVTVGEGAIIAAGSNVNKDVPANAMAIGRSRQENHSGWASEYKKVKMQQQGAGK